MPAYSRNPELRQPGREYMRQRKISLREVAARSGLQYEYCSFVLNGHRVGSDNTRAKIAAAVGLTVNECFRPREAARTP